VTERLLKVIIGLVIGIYIARYLGPVQFGKLSYAVSFTGLFMILTALGLDNIVIRELVRYHSQAVIAEVLGASFFLRIIASIFAFLLMASVAVFMPVGHDETLMILIIGASFFFLSANIIVLYFQARVEAKFTVYAQVLQIICSAIIKIILVQIKAPLVFFAWALLFDSLVLAILLFCVYLKREGFASFRAWNFRRSKARMLLRDSWPLLVAGFTVTAYMKVDQIMIRQMLDPGAVGIYAVAVRISEVWYFVPVVITTSVFPAIIRARRNDLGVYTKRLQQLFNLMPVLALCIALPVSFLSADIVEILFGTQFGEAGSVLAIHVWACIFVFLQDAAWRWYVAENKQVIGIRWLLIGLLSNVVLNYFVIPRWGILGAAWTTLIARGLAGYLGHMFSGETRSLFWMLTRSLLFLDVIIFFTSGRFSNSCKVLLGTGK